MTTKNKILITGASGFIGTRLLEKLTSFPFQIACIDLNYNDKFIQAWGNRILLYQGDLLDETFVASCINEFSPNLIYHLAGSKNRSNALSEFKNSFNINYLGTLNLFKSCLNCTELQLITVLGTIEEYGTTSSPYIEESYEMPISAYGLSKLSVTKLSRIFSLQFNLPILVLRPSIAYGPGQGEDMFIPSLIMSLLKKNTFPMTEGLQFRDFIYIDDLVDSMLRGININGLSGNVINIASCDSIRLKDVALKISQMLGSPEKLQIGALPYRQSEIMNYMVNIDKAKKMLRWEPIVDLEEGLNITIKYYKNNFNEA